MSKVLYKSIDHLLSHIHGSRKRKSVSNMATRSLVDYSDDSSGCEEECCTPDENQNGQIAVKRKLESDKEESPAKRRKDDDRWAII